MTVSARPPRGTGAVDDTVLVRAARDGSQAAFRDLVTRHQPDLLRLARRLAPDAATAEEVVQDAWIALLEGLHRFAERSSLKTWLCGVVVHVAQARSRKERRYVSLSMTGSPNDARGGSEAGEREVASLAELPASSPWSEASSRCVTPEAMVLRSELRSVLTTQLNALPLAQRSVLTLREVEGWSAREVCAALGMSASHQRVLLHRARCGMQGSLSWYERTLLGYLVAGKPEAGTGAVITPPQTAVARRTRRR